MIHRLSAIRHRLAARPSRPAIRWQTVLAACLGLALLAPTAARAQNVAIEAMMVEASEDGAVDPALGAVHRYLAATFKGRFAGYRLAGRGNAVLPVGGKAGKIGLGGRFVTDVQVTAVEGQRVRMRVTWKNGDRVYCNTTLTLDRARPFIVGGPRQGDNTLLLVVQSK